MKIRLAALCALTLAIAGCATGGKPRPTPTPAPDGKAAVSPADDEDAYAVTTIADPLEPLNRATFILNDGIYTVIIRPISRGYETIVPRPVRRGLNNAFENVKFPVRFVNDTLQGQFSRAGLETGKFAVNSTLGIGGLLRVSDRFPALADLPPADTGQTFAKWGLGHGFYLVLPVLGPTSLRDGVGLAGDYALNPITWFSFIYGAYAWSIAVPATNTLRAAPDQIKQYDAITKDALERYLAMRTAYIQSREQAARR